MGVDQGLSDEPGHERAESRVANGRPDHVAGDRDGLVRRSTKTTCADNSHSTPTKARSMSVDCTRPTVRSTVSSRKAARIFLDALVGVDADFAAERQ